MLKLSVVKIFLQNKMCKNFNKMQPTEKPQQMQQCDRNIKIAVVLQFLGMSALLLKYKTKKRRWWVRDILQKRDTFGDVTNLVQEMRLKDTESFYNFVRMTEVQFDLLLHKVGPSLTKNSIRRPIIQRDRILVTLRFLATGMSFVSLSYSFRIGSSTISNIVKETTEAIWISLNAEYIPKPSVEDLHCIAARFYSKSGTPNCVGAIDGKYCVIQCPPNSGSLFFNYKKTLSVVLLAVCDADYNFTYVNVGAYGSESDAGVLKRSDFGQALLSNSLSLPQDEALPDSLITCPFYFVGDEAFPLKRHLMRSYGGRHLSPDKRNFNKRLSSARRLIENSFGILASKFRIYHTVINANFETATSIIQSTVVLHNFILKTRTSATVIGQNTVIENEDNIGNWQNVTQQLVRITVAMKHST